MPSTEPPWPAPDRTDPPMTGSERELLDAWLDYHRDTLLAKCSGLSAEQLCERACPPSTLSLLGLVRHLADVERGWFGDFLDPRPEPLYWSETDRDGDFDNTEPGHAGDDLEALRLELDAARRTAAGHQLDEVSLVQVRGHDVSLRWIYLHMIEEYARHNGHADLLRQRIDGATGD